MARGRHPLPVQLPAGDGVSAHRSNLPAIQQTFASEPNIAVLAPIALTIPALMIAIFSAPAGFLADRLGRRQVLIGSLVVYLIAGIAPAFLNSIGAIIAARAVVGLAEAAIVTCSTTLIGDYYSVPTRNKYVSLQAASTSIASVIFLLDRRRAWRTRLARDLLGLRALPRSHSRCLHRRLEPGGDPASFQRLRRMGRGKRGAFPGSR